MHFHCSANFWPSPGVVIKAADSQVAAAAYRASYSVPDTIEVQVQEVRPLPNGGWQAVEPD